ncbi:hypothetical protein HY480_02610 [Candidatus Uhrbacteria bacterium]|nr:hypothetical protein [Candidatus Uhrbacteria bacterium]
MAYLRICVDYARDEERGHAVADAIRAACGGIAALGVRDADIIVLFVDRHHGDRDAAIEVQGNIPDDALRAMIATAVGAAFLGWTVSPRTVRVYVRRASPRDGGFSAHEAFVFGK